MPVYLIGAGPGDPDLITLKAVKALNKADVVLYDYLANEEILAHAPAEAERIYVAEKKKHMMNRCKTDEVVTRTISKLYAPILGKTYSYYYNGLVVTVYCDGQPHKYPKFVAENIDKKLNSISEANTYKEVIEDRQNQDSF